MNEPTTPLPWVEQLYAIFPHDDAVPIWRAEMYEGASQDAAYIVHAANAYPRLVETLQRIVQRGCAPYPPPDAEILASSRELAQSVLLELGEGL